MDESDQERRSFRAYFKDKNDLREIKTGDKEFHQSRIVKQDGTVIKRSITVERPNACELCNTSLNEDYTMVDHAEEGCPVFDDEVISHNSVFSDATTGGLSNVTEPLSDANESSGWQIGNWNWSPLDPFNVNPLW